MGLFELKSRSSRELDSKIVDKSNKKTYTQEVVVKGGGKNSTSERIATIKALVEKYLGKFSKDYIAIRDEKTLEDYITTAIKDGKIAIDTETTSLEPITTTLAGISLFSISNKPAYIPINHVSSVTGEKVINQLSEEFICNQLKRLVKNNVEVKMFNAKFDMRVLRHQLNLTTADGEYLLKANFDGYLAARILNENEEGNGLKELYSRYIDSSSEALNFDDFFKGIPFTMIPINTGYLYAAHDAKITYELCEYQEKFLDKSNRYCIDKGLEGIAKVFHDIEMPIIQVVAEMEDNGIELDFNYQSQLSKKYHEKLEEKIIAFHAVCDMYSKEIQDYKQKNINHKLDEKININSPVQMAELFYDILKLKNNSAGSPRSTQEKFIKDIEHPVIKALLDCREIEKLINTYIDKMPEIVNPLTGKIHCSFNQYGAVTGRFSSSEPNMQNIPRENTDIRPMFTAAKGNVLLFSDYSGQEVKLTAHASEDDKLIEALKQGKDPYVEIASIAFRMPYDECSGVRPDGTKNPEGKERRQKAKAIVLGICYGKQIPSIATDLGVSNKIAQEIYDKVMHAFPKLHAFIIDSQTMATELGYVETIYGRKRRLPDMQRERYEFSWLNGISKNFDPLADDDEEVEDEGVPFDTQKKFINMLNKAHGFKAKYTVFELAKKENIKIVDNSGYISKAERQCVNSRIQGSAADLTKIAMFIVGTSKELKNLGFKLILQVHDELIGECPLENWKECAKLLSDLMLEAAKDLSVPMVCDTKAAKQWYGEKIV